MEGVTPRPTEMAEFRVGELPWPSLAMVQSGWACEVRPQTVKRIGNNDDGEDAPPAFASKGLSPKDSSSSPEARRRRALSIP